MNIYFACSITGGRDDQAVYQKIVEAMLAAGHEVPTAHLANSNTLEMETNHPADEVYARDTAWIEACDALVAEVSTPSHGVGYEIAYALNLGKPLLCIYQKDAAVSKMLTGNDQPTLRVQSYADAKEAVQLVEEFLAEISPKI